MEVEGKMSLDRIDELMRAVFEELIAREGSATGRDALAGVPRRVKLTETDKGLNPGGFPRWETNLRLYSIDCTKAGYLQKQNGYWKITDLGSEALKLPNGAMIRSATKAYRLWKANRDGSVPPPPELEIAPPPGEDPLSVRLDAFERAEEQAREGIEQHLQKLNPYEFQDMVGHLLRAMGYFVAHNAPAGPDGGVDLLVYKDPLGTVAPRVKVQVKHRRDTKISVREIRELHGLLHADEVGLMVSSGGFTSDAAREARASSKHIDMIDLERFVTLWEQHYGHVKEDGQAMLPLAPVYFLAPVDD
jgi:restriction system protein